jgi:conjugal transfer pilus assembly protein TraB
MIDENKISVLKQRKTLIITITAIAGVLMIFFSSGGKKSAQSNISKTITDTKNKIILQDPNRGANAEDRWLYDAEKKLDDYGKFQKDYAQDKGNIESRLVAIEKNYEEKIDTQTGLIESQGQEIQNLKNQITTFKQPANAGKQDPFATGANSNSMMPVVPRTIQTTNLELEKTAASAGEFFKAEEYVPAGAYAEAVIISGVDASVGTAAQSDPRPVLVRIKGPALSSIYEGNTQKADLTGCLVTGAASGDLSSEKVYVKLVNMTCAKSEDLVYETAIKGYVAGQGKSGVRGNVISRAGDIVTKSFLAGMIGGFGQGLSARVAPPLNFSNGLTTQGVMSTEDVAKKGLGQGFATSGDRLSNYFIQRAEQYQPVVSIPSGIDVEVVFVEGFHLNGKRHRAPTALNNRFITRFEGGAQQ